MAKENKPTSDVSNNMKKRTVILSAFFVLVCCVGLVARLIKIQVVDYEKYQVRASSQQLRDTKIAANRGTIYDANMKVLAQSATVWTVFISPKEISDEKADAIAAGLSELLEVDKDAILQKMKNKDSYYEVIKYKIEKPKADEVRAFATENSYSGIYFVQDSKRYYPYGQFASTLLGFTGTDNQGLSGLEAYYDKELTGTPGRTVSAKNAWGFDMPYQYEAMYEAQDGDSLVLTIDETIQHYMEKHLNYAVQEHNVTSGGVGIVMDVKTGAILALAVSPGYDPNDPFTIQDQTVAAAVAAVVDDPATTDVDERKTALSNAREKQWRNKAVQDLYEPGSVFKLITASAALDSGAATINSGYVCTGSINVAGTTMRCAHPEGHGSETLAQALINSCNPAFITIGAQVGAARFYDYFNAFGLTEKTGIDLPAEAQSQYYTADKLGPVELASCSFGQSNKITPIQMITAVSAVVNGGYLVRPHLVSQVLDSSGNIVSVTDTTPRRQVISEETSKAIASIMEEAVSNGPCNNAYVMGYRVGGKSGTSQKLDSADSEARIASFVGIAPADDPQIAVLVILDEPHSYSSYGGVLAAPVVGSVISETLPYLGIAPSYSDSEMKNVDVAVPNVTTLPLDQAQVALQKKGFNAKTVGSGSSVVRQFPTSGQSMTQGSTVILYTETADNNLVTVPSFIGRSPAAAQQLAQSIGLNLKRSGATGTGSGVEVVSQTVSASEQVPIGTVITVEYRDKTVKDDA